jgi:hypothetical protein
VEPIRQLIQRVPAIMPSMKMVEFAGSSESGKPSLIKLVSIESVRWDINKGTPKRPFYVSPERVSASRSCFVSKVSLMR